MGVFFTFPVKSKVVVFKNLAAGEKVLFIYDSKADKQEALKVLIRASLLEKKPVFYSYAFPEGAVETEWREGLKIYGMSLRRSVEKSENNLQNLRTALESFLAEHRRGLVVLDFDSAPSYILQEELVTFLRSLFEVFPGASVITCFSIDVVDVQFLEQILGLYSLVVVSADAEKTVVSPVVVHGKRKRHIGVVSAEVADILVKKFLDLVVLSILSEQPMHGYNIIKVIFRRYGVLVSQGMLYPLLHGMEKENLLRQEAANRGRGKVYVLTSRGRRVARTKLRELSETLHYLLGLIGGGNSMSP
jgi:DNA-binding PadR family transcriptional regulator